ncbi:carboxymuconolactone decarboxylase family protein [Tumebacillus lipolyticus]|uniref:Carboxymuconolactone decarboxylase family protein n=1 Tax=Tumebacillus lipolyticus TaxID=1280370 RepID=A0ABW4ZTJ4_9BACL
MNEQEYSSYIVDSIREYKRGLADFSEKLPDVGERYLEFTAACFHEGALSESSKHLIALGIAICAQDEYCIMYHAHAALATGASEQEVLETIGVCGAFGGGAAMSQGVTLVQDVLDVYHRPEH